MIISKKKLEQIVRQRIEEREREHYLLHRIDGLEKELHTRIDRLCEQVWRLEQQKNEVKMECVNNDR